LTGNTTATSGDDDVRVDFDPDDEKAVRRFARQISELNERKAVRILRSLTRPQKKAYADVMKPTDFETTITEVTDSGISIQDSGSRAYSVTTTAKSGSGLVAYRYEVTVNFGWDDAHEEITTLDADAGAETTGLPWRYRGEDTDIVSNNGESGYIKQTGNFGMCTFVPTCVIVDERNPTISLRVYPGGDVNVLEKDNDK
jgi:hypothetical protein